MAYAVVTSLGENLGIDGGTTVPIDTTGANLIVMFSTWLNQFRDPAGFEPGNTFTDSYGNDYTLVTNQALVVMSFSARYCLNPIVGPGHTFTQAAANTFDSIGVIAFSGAVSEFESEVHNSGAPRTSIQAGGITSTYLDPLVVSCLLLHQIPDTPSINSSFTIETAVPEVLAENVGAFMAYRILSAGATSLNPTWSWSTSGTAGVINLGFPGLSLNPDVDPGDVSQPAQGTIGPYAFMDWPIEQP